MTTGASLRLAGAARSYQGAVRVDALRPSDLDVPRGDYVAVVGPSGSGKSTLMNILGLLDRPSQGTYFLDGQDTAPLSEGARTKLRASRLGFVFQHYHLIPYRTALENVELGLMHQGVKRSERRRRAEAAIVDVGLEHRRDAIPSTLSGGERQRVAIARAIAGRPGALLCDEPTGNLDEAAADTVVSIFEQLNQRGLTVIVVTHDPRVAQRANRVIRLRDGQLALSRPAPESHHAAS